jgi:hypothetical protein
MHARFVSGTGKAPVGDLLGQLAPTVVLFLPASLLILVALRTPEASRMLWLGAAILALGCLLVRMSRFGGRESIGPAVIMLYVVALIWLLIGVQSAAHDWFLHLTQATLLVVPLGFFGVQCLRDSGAVTLRRARRLAAQLAARKHWPTDLMECRLLPELKALREALQLDATPALELLANPRPAVRVAALTALEFRPTWRPGQPQVVLQVARRAAEPEVRATAVYALANVEDRHLVEALADLLRDRSPLVRQTTAEALLWHTETRWTWFRDTLRQALGDGTFKDDGPLPLPGTPLTAEVLGDLHAWCAEKGPVAIRAAQTLGA